MQGLYPLNRLHESRSESCELVFALVQVLNDTKNLSCLNIADFVLTQVQPDFFWEQAAETGTGQNFSWLRLISSVSNFDFNLPAGRLYIALFVISTDLTSWSTMV